VGRRLGRVLSEPYGSLWEGYLAFLERRVSEQGYKTMRNTSFRFLKWLEEQDIRPEEATVQDALRYRAAVASLVTREGKPIAAETCNSLLQAGRRVFRYLATIGAVNNNPFCEVNNPRKPDRISQNVLTEAQMNVLLEHLRRFDNVENYKVHVLAELLYATGLRIAEAASLVPADLDTRQRFVYVRKGKGGKSRTAFLTGYAAEVLDRYITRGRQLVLDSYHGPRLQGHTLFCVCPIRLSEELKLVFRSTCPELELPVITSHGFRHSLGTHLLRAGCDMRHIQVILGHDRLQTTQVYTKVDKDDIKKSLDAHHPRQWKQEGTV